MLLDKENIKGIDWQGLHGKQVLVLVGTEEQDGVKTTCVSLVDKENNFYIIHTGQERAQKC